MRAPTRNAAINTMNVANVTVGRRLGYLSGAPRVSTRPNAEVSGARTHVLGVINAFCALGWDVDTYIVGDRIHERFSASGSERAMAGGSLRLAAADTLRIGLGAWHSYGAYRELGGKVDWVYERLGLFQSLGRRFKKAGVPWILESNALLAEEATKRNSVALASIAHQIEMDAYRDCDVVVCVSEELKVLLTERASVPREKVLVVPNGVDTSVYDPEAYAPKRLFSEFTIGFVGSLYPWQALDVLFYAVQELWVEMGIDIRVTVVGDGAMRGRWEQLCFDIGIGDRVRFVGRVPALEVPKYIAGFDLAYSGQSSVGIGAMYLSPLKLYEYQAMAKPVVASAYADASRLIRHGETGYLFEPNNRESLKQAIIEAYQAGSRLNELGKQARVNVVERHSWISRVNEMIRGIQGILGARQ